MAMKFDLVKAAADVAAEAMKNVDAKVREQTGLSLQGVCGIAALYGEGRIVVLPEGPQTRGGMIRSMTDSQLARWIVFLSRLLYESEFDMTTLWCDNLGECMQSGNCSDSGRVNCVLRYLSKPAPEKEKPAPPAVKVRDYANISRKRFFCPACGEWLASYTFGQAWAENGLPLPTMDELWKCPKCGQAIDWAGQVIARDKDVPTSEDVADINVGDKEGT